MGERITSGKVHTLNSVLASVAVSEVLPGDVHRNAFVGITPVVHVHPPSHSDLGMNFAHRRVILERERVVDPPPAVIDGVTDAVVALVVGSVLVFPHVLVHNRCLARALRLVFLVHMTIHICYVWAALTLALQNKSKILHSSP